MLKQIKKINNFYLSNNATKQYEALSVCLIFFQRQPVHVFQIIFCCFFSPWSKQFINNHWVQITPIYILGQFSESIFGLSKMKSGRYSTGHLLFSMLWAALIFLPLCNQILHIYNQFSKWNITSMLSLLILQLQTSKALTY